VVHEALALGVLRALSHLGTRAIKRAVRFEPTGPFNYIY